MITLSISAPVLAADPTPSPSVKHSIIYDSVYYSPGTSCSATPPISLNGSDNLQKAFNYFTSQGLSPVQAVALMGNLQGESGVGIDPGAQQDKSSDPFPKNGVGFGIAQWTFSSRQDKLVAFAKSLNQPVNTIGVQLQFVMHELTIGFGHLLENLKQTTDMSAATDMILRIYEDPSKNEGVLAGYLAKRLGYAQGDYKLYGGSAAPTASTPAGSVPVPASSTGCDSSGPGQNTKFIDGFTVYSQYDPAWKDKPYGVSTIGDSGCGPSAMAMIITALTGQDVTPVDTSNYAAASGQQDVPFGRSKWSIGPTLAAHWGLKSVAVPKDIAKITASLQSGALIIVSGSGAEPFTSGGHFIVIRGVTADGKWKVGDSAHSNTSAQSWDPSAIYSDMNDNAYAISK